MAMAAQVENTGTLAVSDCAFSNNSAKGVAQL